MKSFSRLAALALAVVLSGCAFNTQIGYPDSTSNKGKKVSASLTHFNIFFLVPADNTQKLMEDLSEQCGNGKVEGVASNRTDRYIWFFGDLTTVDVVGHCVE
jgi:hypothetical protein